MNSWLEQLRIFAPESLLVSFCVLVLFLFVQVMASWKRSKVPRRDGRFVLAAIGDMPKSGGNLARLAHASKLVFSIAIVVLTAFLWGELTVRETGDGTAISRQEPVKTLLAVFDMSSSMGTPFGGQERGSRFAVAKEALATFLTNEQSTRAGVIFYSTEVFEYRRPTRDLDELVDDFSYLDITRDEGQPLSELSWGTDTAQALEHAAVVMDSLELDNVRSSVVILVSDLLDDKMKIAYAVGELVARRIRVYILSIEGEGSEPSAAVADALALNPQVRAFHIRSPDDMREVYPAIALIESSLSEIQEPVADRQIRSRTAVLVLFGLLLGFAVVSELALPKIRKSS